MKKPSIIHNQHENILDQGNVGDEDCNDVMCDFILLIILEY